eukprot:TRINITY_DN3291_c0_g1_i2.p1 TRINITY_DN3291_c0_g1~~TRINITY_DN3291_c0_g1_i2.p1  ORF type:complete len:228 (+),score=63.86 TRINITY_DN3291_c0_g1_i2:133-816(+)
MSSGDEGEDAPMKRERKVKIPSPPSSESSELDSSSESGVEQAPAKKPKEVKKEMEKVARREIKESSFSDSDSDDGEQAKKVETKLFVQAARPPIIDDSLDSDSRSSDSSSDMPKKGNIKGEEERKVGKESTKGKKTKKEKKYEEDKVQESAPKLEFARNKNEDAEAKEKDVKRSLDNQKNERISNTIDAHCDLAISNIIINDKEQLEKNPFLNINIDILKLKPVLVH